MTRHASAAPRGADTESTADLRVKLGEKAEALAQQLLVNHSQEQEILALSSKLLLGESEHQQETCELKRELNAAAATITSLKAQLEAYKLSASSAETNQLTQQREGFMNSLDPKVPIMNSPIAASELQLKRQGSSQPSGVHDTPQKAQHTTAATSIHQGACLLEPTPPSNEHSQDSLLLIQNGATQIVSGTHSVARHLSAPDSPTPTADTQRVAISSRQSPALSNASPETTSYKVSAAAQACIRGSRDCNFMSMSTCYKLRWY